MDTLLNNKSDKYFWQKNLVIWLLALTTDYAIIAGAFYIAYIWGWIAYPFTLLFLGIAQHRLSVLGHEGVHGIISRNKHVNYWLAQLLCFWPLMTDIKSYRKFHSEHHRHAGIEYSDPEFELKHDRYHFPITRKKLFSRFFLDLFGGSFAEFLEATVYFAKRDNPFWAPSFVIISAALTYFTGHFEFFVLFMLAKPTTFWAVFRLRIYTEHVDIEGTHRVHLSLWQKLLFSPHNIGIHWEHHNYPQIPFWQLPKLRAQYKDEPIIRFSELLHRSEAREENKRNEVHSSSHSIEIV